MYILCLIILGLTFFIQLLAASWYDLSKKTHGPAASFKYKMLCSGIYIADILLCGAISSPFCEIWFYLILAGYILFFISDIAEDKSKHGANTSLLLKSAAALLTGASFVLRAYTQFSVIPFQGTLAITIYSVLIVLSFAILFIKEMSLLQKFYSVSALFAVASAVILGILFQNTQLSTGQAASCAIIMGCLSIGVSSLVSVSKHKDSKSLLITNLYYFGLMFTACSII